MSNTDTWPMDVSLAKPLVPLPSLSVIGEGDFLVAGGSATSRSRRVFLMIR